MAAVDAIEANYGKGVLKTGCRRGDEGVEMKRADVAVVHDAAGGVAGRAGALTRNPL